IRNVSYTFDLFYNGKLILNLHIYYDTKLLKIFFKDIDSKFNRFWLRINADINEIVYGCGEQLSYFNLIGRNFPIWTSEPG
ncbi:alpha-glucosidase, partial [Francisella tularensis subsp. holarctica]|nr:alpha-glucosidase [Francisella tularensis subsp. holarctica]